MINENKKGVKAVKHTTKAKGVEPPKPRNFVAKNAINTGAGAHKDKKKAVKQGDVKHKNKEYAESLQDKLTAAIGESNQGYEHGFASPTAPSLSRRRDHDSGDDEPQGVFTVIINGKPWKEATSNEAFAMAQRVANKHPDKKIAVKWPTGQLNAVKAQGVAEGKEKFNYELSQKGFHFEQEISGVTYKVYNKKGGSDNIKIDALDQKKQVIGHASFWRHQYKDGLESLSTSVEPAWQGKGIATNMYAVMRMLGVNIHPASMQTDDGKKMWSKWNKQGDAQHIKSMNPKMTEQGVAEGGNPKQAAIAIAKKESGKYTKDGKRKTNEGWTHDSLAAELFEIPSYENRLQEMLDGQVAFMEGGTDDGVSMFSKLPGSHQHKNDAGKQIPDDKMKSAQPGKTGSKDEYDQEGEYVKNQLHTIKRVVTHLEHAIDDDENLPEWVQDKISQAKGMIVSVMDYMISEKEMAMNKQTGHDDDIMA